MGRPQILNTEQKKEIAGLLAHGKTSKYIASLYGVAKRTIDRLRSYPEIKATVRGLAMDEITRILSVKFKEGTTADRELYLKYIEKWNPTSKIETGKPGEFDLSEWHRTKEKK